MRSNDTDPMRLREGSLVTERGLVFCPPNVDCPCYAKMGEEITLLRAEVESAREANASMIEARDQMEAFWKREHQEATTLRAEVKRLTAACSTAMAQLDEHRIIWAYDTLKTALTAQEKTNGK
jgi:hypothetical protein